jgi:hypothetical protein
MSDFAHKFFEFFNAFRNPPFSSVPLKIQQSMLKMHFPTAGEWPCLDHHGLSVMGSATIRYAARSTRTGGCEANGAADRSGLLLFLYKKKLKKPISLISGVSTENRFDDIIIRK